jgi:MGT family glycosyltransferase
MRFLFVVPPFAGHINPTVSVGSELAARGHEVAWCGYTEPLSRLLDADARRYELAQAADDPRVAEVAEKVRSVRGFANLKVMWEEVFVPLARAMIPGVERAAVDFRPTVLVSDQQALGGAVVARRKGVRWATFATSPVSRERALGGLPKVLAWTEARLAELQREQGMSPVAAMEDAPELVVVFSVPALAGAAGLYPPQYRFVGAALAHRPDSSDFPWEALEPAPRVLVSLGSLNVERGGRFFEAVKQALGGMRLQAIVVAPDHFGPFPRNFLVRDWIPQLALLPKIDAVVSHGGNNSVCETLSHGRPMVVIPITDDQPMIAQQVVDAGCGIRLPFARFRAAAFEDAVRRVLQEPQFGRAARRLEAAFREAGGTMRAADLLEAYGRGETT